MACLEASADGKTARAEAPVRERAQKPAAPDRIRQQLCKTAGLPVRITDCRVALAGAPFLPVSQLNALRREALAALLAQADVQAFLRAMGYGDTSPDGALAFLRQRLAESPCFPHEIGVFLGYPLSDVIAFMRDGGRGCRCSGCWKAYTNECEAMRIFQRYKACRAAYQTLFRAGWPLERLTVRA